MKAKRRRHNKQTPFYAITEDGKVYAANRKARRTAYAQNAIVKETKVVNISEPVTFEGEATSGFAVTQEEQNADNNNSGV